MKRVLSLAAAGAAALLLGAGCMTTTPGVVDASAEALLIDFQDSVPNAVALARVGYVPPVAPVPGPGPATNLAARSIDPAVISAVATAANAWFSTRDDVVVRRVRVLVKSETLPDPAAILRELRQVYP